MKNCLTMEKIISKLLKASSNNKISKLSSCALCNKHILSAFYTKYLIDIEFKMLIRHIYRCILLGIRKYCLTTEKSIKLYRNETNIEYLGTPKWKNKMSINRKQKF